MNDLDEYLDFFNTLSNVRILRFSNNTGFSVVVFNSNFFLDIHSNYRWSIVCVGEPSFQSNMTEKELRGRYGLRISPSEFLERNDVPKEILQFFLFNLDRFSK